MSVVFKADIKIASLNVRAWKASPAALTERHFHGEALENNENMNTYWESSFTVYTLAYPSLVAFGNIVKLSDILIPTYLYT